MKSAIFFTFSLLLFFGINHSLFAREIKSIELIESIQDVQGVEWINTWESNVEKKLYSPKAINIKKETKTILAKITFTHPVRDRYLFLGSRIIDLAEIYLKANGEVKLLGTGGNIQGNVNLNFFTSFPVVEIQDTFYEEAIFVKITSPRFVNLAIELKTPAEFKSESEIGRFFIYSFLGAMFIITIVHCVLFSTFKNITSLFYLGFSWSFAMVMLSSSGVLAYFVEPTVPFATSFYMNWLFVGPLHLCLVCFTWHLLEFENKYKWVIRANVLMGAIITIMGIALAYDKKLMSVFFDIKIILQVLMLLSLALVNILGFKEKKALSSIVALSWAPVMCYGFTSILSLIPSYYTFSAGLLIIPVIFEMIINSLAAYYRLQKIQKDLVEAEIRQSQNNLLRQAMRTLSHDLANHFFVADNNIDVIKKQNPNIEPKILERMERVKKSLAQSKLLLSRVKSWIQVGDGIIRVQNEAIMVIPLVKESIELFEEKAKNKDITIVTKWESDMEATCIWADPVAAFNQVLNNILSNAIKFSFRNSEIIIEVTAHEGHVFVSVKDSGMGIKAEDLIKFHDNGHIESNLGTENEKGTGFGMGLMKFYMNSFGGNVKIKSHTEENNKGTEVILAFKSIVKVQLKDEDSAPDAA